MKAVRLLFPLPIVLIVFAACASPPPAAEPVPVPVVLPDVPLALSIEGVRAVPRTLDTVSVSFNFVVRNADSRQTILRTGMWDLLVDGAKAAEGSVGARISLEPGVSASIPCERAVAIPSTSRDQAAFVIAASAVRDGAGGAVQISKTEASGTFPVIREPRFSIKSIKIKKAELINTKFEVVLRVENPNAVPLRLKSMEYELFGERRLWTDGDTTEVIPVEANGATEKKLKLIMNFINMKRDLLDQVIKLEIVDYRFRGKAKIAVDLPEFSDFVMPYDLTGTTSVVE